MALQEGQVIARRYQVIKHLGTGGMASVYQVWDRERAVYLALKMLRPELAGSSELIELFQREAHHLESLSHPHIVRFYELVRDGGNVFLVMEFVDGPTLRQQMDRARGPLPFARIREILQPICTALYYAHTRGVVHCDLKPGNILIDPSGKTFISDFGIAQMVNTAGSLRNSESLTGAGSPAYMAPEQARYETPSPASDLYSLGILLYEMLTGRRPFYGSAAPDAIGPERDRLTWEKLNTTPVPPSQINPQIPAAVEKVVMRCLSTRAQHRYSDALEVANDVEKAFALGAAAEPPRSAERKPPVQAAPVESKISQTSQPTLRETPTKRAAASRGRSQVALFAVLGVVVVTLLAGLLALTGGGGTRPTAPPANTAASGSSQACMQPFPIPDQPRTHLVECVENIEVQPDGRIKVYVSWTVDGISNIYGVKVGSDQGNKNMYLMDDQGNRLDHVETGDGANQTVSLFPGKRKLGWFLFPAPPANARALYFHDDDNGGISPALDRFR